MHVLRIAVLSLSVGLLSSCSRADAATYDLKICDDSYLSISKALAKSFDYAEVRATNLGAQVLESAGEKCKTAKNREACVAAVDKATSQTGWNNGSHGRQPGHHFAVVTRGDDVTVITTDNLASALGTIDTPVKAALLAGLTRGVLARCEASVRSLKGKYEVHLVSDSCFGSVDDVVTVDPKGSIEVVSSKHGMARCVGAVERASSVATL